MSTAAGPWPVPPPIRPGAVPPTAARRAPGALVACLANPIVAQWFTLWAVDGLLHCDEEGIRCGLGFAVHLLFPAVVGVVGVVYAALVGALVRVRTRKAARALLLAPVVCTWLAVWWALAVTR